MMLPWQANVWLNPSGTTKGKSGLLMASVANFNKFLQNKTFV